MATPDARPQSRGTDHTVWAGQGVAPDDIEGAMRDLERERYLVTGGALPARALNLIVIVDAAFEGEIVRRLDAVGRNAPSRTILLRVSPHRTGLNARVALSASDPGEQRPDATLHERVTIDVGDRHVARLESIVDPVVMPDVPTLVWAPHGHREAFAAVVGLSQSVLLDTTDASVPVAGLRAVHALLAEHDLTVVDLSWLRASPWRLRLAGHFADPRRQRQLERIRALRIRHDSRSAVAGWLLAGWFADRLGWSAGADGIVAADGTPVVVELEAVDLGVQGLGGVTIETVDDCRFSLDRCASGLRAHRVTAERDDRWMVLGASRGESGVLSAAFRRILVPDDGYAGALAAALDLRSAA